MQTREKPGSDADSRKLATHLAAGCAGGSAAPRGDRGVTDVGADPAARLINEFQRGFPLVPAPFAAIAQRLGTDEAWVRATLARWQRAGVVSRVGAVFRPGSIGVSTLAAMTVPREDLARVAALVSARPEVNHNYEREHRLNLWFVAASTDAAALKATLAAIGRETGCKPVSLPLVADYWIDLGFDMTGAVKRASPRAPRGARGAAPIALSDADRRLVAALESGLPLVPAPYAELARASGVSESRVLLRLADWLHCGIIKRLGVVVRHRQLGYVANAMCVWDVPDAPSAAADALGEALAREPGVTLCYRRERALPEWRYNLFCMLHGRDRAPVEARLAEISARHRLTRFPSAVLFSRHAFKQCGARYVPGADATASDPGHGRGARAPEPATDATAAALGD